MDTSFLLPYVLHLADDALILSHRNSEWCGHGPMLEQDIALSNIALDGIGQARNFYQYAAQISGNDTKEDALAFLRDTLAFKNCLFVFSFSALTNIYYFNNYSKVKMRNWQPLQKNH